MVGQITPEFKQRLLARVDIVDVVGRRVPLKPAGHLFKACCPFHEERTPSFVVTPDRQTYHCFGCGVHGNAIDFLIEHDRLSFPEAVEELAQRAGMELPTGDEPVAKGPDLKPILATLEHAARLYHDQLRDHARASRAIDYLKRRGLSGEMAKRFDIGFAPPGWDFLLTRLGQGPAEQELLVHAGLLVERTGKHYDRFRDRIMFPIRNRRGQVIGFGGRVLGDGEPKYLNSPETPVFHKGRELYGLFELQQQRGPARILVVEGYMDVIALAQADLPFAVATLGTATTPEHVRVLLRNTRELVFCFDGDRAGQAAAWKALQTTLPLVTGRQPVRFLLLPQGEDPDTLVRKEGRDGFDARIDHAELLSDFLFNRLLAKLDMRTTEGRAQLDAEARPLIESAPQGTFRALLEARLDALVGIPTRPAPGAPRRPRQAGRPGTATPLTAPRLAIALLLENPRLATRAQSIPGDWRDPENAGARLLGDLLDVIAACPTISAAALIEHWRGSDRESVVNRLSDPGLIAHIPTEGKADELVGAIRRMGERARQERRQQIMRDKRRASDLSEQDKAGLRGRPRPTTEEPPAT